MNFWLEVLHQYVIPWLTSGKGESLIMHSVNFIKSVGDFFETWFKIIAFRIARGEIQITGSYSFPTILRVGESPFHYTVELLGSTDMNSFLKEGLRRPTLPENYSSTTAFFNPGFDVDEKQVAAMRISGQYHTYFGFAFCTEYDQKVFSKKVNFPISPVQIMPSEATLPLIILPSSDYLIFRHIDLVRADTFKVMFRTISTAMVFKKTIQKDVLTEWLSQTANQMLNDADHSVIFGINMYFHADCESFARQLASLSDQDITEPNIDRFIQTHIEQFTKALGYKRGLSQVTLEWIDRNGDDPKESKPDYLLEREDGYFDILDLKKAALRGKSVTQGSKARVRFNSYVSELIAQLNGYERYFKREENRKWAMENFGIKVKNPQLIGVVGNYDSFIRENVDLALEQYKDNIVVLSYQDIINLLRKRVIFTK